MTEKSAKYIVTVFYIIFFALLVFYSYTFKRADEIIYAGFLTAVFFISLYLNRTHPEKSFNALFTTLAVSAAVITVYGFFRAFRFPGLRISGLLGDRVFEAEAAAVIFVFFSAMYFLSGGSKAKTAISGIAVFITFAYLSLLRVKAAYAAVFVCLLAAGALLLFLRRNELREKYKASLKKTAVFLIILLASAAVPLLSPYNQPSDRDSIPKLVTGAFDLNSSTNSARLDFWKASVKMLAGNPATGIGAGMWPGVYPKYNGPVYTDGNVDMNSAVNPHNDYLKFLSEYGVAGIFYFLLIAFGIVILVRRTAVNLLYLPVLLITICFAVTSFFSFTYDNVFAAALLIFCISSAYTAPDRIGKRVTGNITLVLSAVILIITSALMIFRFAYESSYKEAIQMKFRNDYRGAVEKLSTINDIIYPSDPNRIPVSYYAGTSYFELKDYESSLKYFNRAVALMPYYPTIMSNRAGALYKTGKVKEAIELYRETARLFPDFFEPQINLLAVCANEKMHNDAKLLIEDIGKRITEPKFIKNYIVFIEIKNYYIKNGL